MTERSYFWKDAAGDASLNPYDSDEFSDFIRKTFEPDRTVANVLMGYLDNLEISNPSPLTIVIKSGAALVDGKLYVNDEETTYSLTPPGSGTDYYSAILRKSWANSTVTFEMLVQNGSSPTLTQSDGTVWEVILYQFSLTSGGVISVLTDARRGLAVNRNRSVLHANSQGSTRYKVQLGVIRWTGGASATGNVTVNFTYAFDSTPTVICTHQGNFFINCVVQPTTSSVVIYWKDILGTTRTSLDINWIAIGAMVRE